MPPARRARPARLARPDPFSKIVETIAERLDGSASEAVEELRSLDAEYREGLRALRAPRPSSRRTRPSVTSPPATASGSCRSPAPPRRPSLRPRELERLIEGVRASGATTVFAEPLVSDRVAETVAREAGAEVAVLDPVEGLSDERLEAGEDYLSVMRANLAVLRDALGCR